MAKSKKTSWGKVALIGGGVAAVMLIGLPILFNRFGGPPNPEMGQFEEESDYQLQRQRIARSRPPLTTSGLGVLG